VIFVAIRIVDVCNSDSFFSGNFHRSKRSGYCQRLMEGFSKWIYSRMKKI